LTLVRNAIKIDEIVLNQSCRDTTMIAIRRRFLNTLPILFLPILLIPIGTHQADAFQSGSEPNAIVKNDDSGKRYFKGNLHTHSLWSDGNDFPEMIVKWYVDHDYHFLALTDHNILADREKWMPVPQIVKRGGKNALEKYIEAFGDDWVETRAKQSEEPSIEVRLKKYTEFRPRFDKKGEFLLMTGEEISDSVGGLPVHMNATNLKNLIRPSGGKTVREAIQNNMRAAIDQAKQEDRKILVHLNHPNFGWAVTAEDLAAATLEKYFEVYNGHPGVNHLGDKNRPGVERLWDIANTIRIAELEQPPMLGLATDDGHYYHGRPGSHPGRGWVMVRSESLDAESLLTAIDRGDFYCSSGVDIKSIEYDADSKKFSVQINGEEGVTYQTKFVGTPREYDKRSAPRLDANKKVLRATRVYSKDIGKTFASVDGLNPSYQLSGDELYVRAVITSTKEHPDPSFEGQTEQAWTQPVGWKKDR